MIYGFSERLAMSTQALQLETDMATLKAYFPNVADVRKTDIEEDKTGIDYVVTLESGIEVGVDVKTREKGCSKYWKNGEPEIALETWSQLWPSDEKDRNQIGWTIDGRKRCQYVMFKFDQTDCATVFIFPFQQLHKAFRRHGKTWYSQYRHAYQYQTQARYKSECVFIPAKVVMDAVKNEFLTEVSA